MAGLPPRRPCPSDRCAFRDEEVVEVIMDGGEEDDDEHRDDSTSGSSVAEVSLAQLEADVREAKREVDHLWFLLLRAAWHAVVARRQEPSPAKRAGRGDYEDFPQKPPSRSSRQLTVDERRAQVSATRGRARHGPSTGRLNESRYSRHSSVMDTSYNGAASTQKPPFLPPARYPVMPALDPDELQRIHHHLSRAVSDVATSGGLLRTRTPVFRGHPQGRHNDYNSASRVMHVSSIGTSSIRATALRLSADALPTTAATAVPPNRRRRTASPARTTSSTASSHSRPARPHGTHTHDATQSTPASTSTRAPTARVVVDTPLQSVSLLILKVARRRAVAMLYLRQLRLDVYRRQIALVEVDLRHDYYLQRRVLTRWNLCAKASAARARVILGVCVQVWQAAVMTRKEARAATHRFAEGLRTRTARHGLFCARRRRRYWERWLNAFTSRRVERALAPTAAAFQESHPRTRCLLPAHLLPLQGAGTLGLRLSNVTSRYALRCFFRAWHDRFAKRALFHKAEGVHRERLRRKVVHRLCTVAADALRDTQANPRPRAKLTEPVLNRALMVHVTASPQAQALWVYKEGCATRISQSRLLQRIFWRWRCRCDVRLALRFHHTHVCFTVLRLWVKATALRHQRSITVRALWSRWRTRVAQRTLGTQAFQCIHQAHVKQSTFHHWRQRTQARCLRTWSLQRNCLLHWWERAALRASRPLLERSRLATLFRHWSDRAEHARRRRLSLALADTLRETALLLGCLRLWSARCADRRHGLTAIAVFEELRVERHTQRLFSLWKRRTFGSTEPFAP